MHTSQASLIALAVRLGKCVQLTLLLFSVVCSTTLVAQDNSLESGTVYLLRRTGISGAADGYSVFMDGQRLCVLNNKRYSVHMVQAGVHKFSVRFNGNNEKKTPDYLEIAVEPGKDYYIALDQVNGLTVKLTLQELAASSGKKAMEDLTKDDNCK